MKQFLKSNRKFEKLHYKLRKTKLDFNFLIKCQHAMRKRDTELSQDLFG